jgi:hypothetical protein
MPSSFLFGLTKINFTPGGEKKQYDMQRISWQRPLDDLRLAIAKKKSIGYIESFCEGDDSCAGHSLSCP